MGEKEPLTNFSLTHGVCGTCKDLPSKSKQSLVEIKALQSDLLRRVWAVEYEDAASVVEQAASLGIKPFDLFMGIIQPALLVVGEEWAKGSVSVVQEHAFTAFAEEVLVEVKRHTSKSSQMPQTGGSVDILLSCVDNNMHTIGLRALALGLQGKGYSCRCLTPGVPTDEIVNVASVLHAKVVGLSIALPEQVPTAVAAASRLRQAGVAVLAGGNACRFVEVTAAPFDFVYVGEDLLDLYQFVDATLRKSAA